MTEVEEVQISNEVEEVNPVGSRPNSGSEQPTGSRPASSSNNEQTSTNSRPTTASNVPPPNDGSRPTSRSSVKSLNKQEDTSSVGTTKSNANFDTEALIDEKDPPRGCWYSFSSCVRGMWATKEMTGKDDREIFIRTTLRELIIYMIFLIVFCCLTFGMTSTTEFYYARVMGSLFDSHKDVSQISEFWEWMEGDFLDGVYWEYMYDGENAKRTRCPGGEEAKGACPVIREDRNIFYENRFLGLPRIRQLRVKNDSCKIHPDFQNAIKECYAQYSPEHEDHEPFGTGYQFTEDNAWNYNDPDITKGTVATGYVATYGAGGAYHDFHSLKEETARQIKELKERLWISKATRFVTLDFTVYNANINLFCIVKIFFEFPATGGVIPNAYYRTVKLLRYVHGWDYFLLANEVIFLLFIVYFIIEEILEIFKLKISYFASVWNNLDIIVLISSTLCIGLTIYSIVVVEAQLAILLETPDSFADFTSLGDTIKDIFSCISFTVFFAWIKVFKYISFNKTMSQLPTTLQRCAADLVGFFVMFAIVFIAFVQLGYLIFGTQIKDYSTFGDAVFTLMRIILGDFDFAAIESADRVIGPIYFLSYVFFVFFVLLNMFLAIINDTYSEVKAEMSTQRNDFELRDYLKRGYNNMLGHVSGKNKYIDIENALKIAGQDGIVTYEEIRQNLKKCNFSDMEIEMFFARYDVDGNFVFTANETNRILNDISWDRVDRPDTSAAPQSRPMSVKEAQSARASATGERPRARGGISGEEFQVLEKRVGRMEKSVGSICTKIDAVLAKLETMEKGRNKRKQAMSKILGHMTAGDADDASKRQEVEAMVRKELDLWDSSRPSTSESQNN